MDASLAQQAQVADDIENHIRSHDLKNWRPLPYEPFYCDYHPCIHRWFRTHNEPRPPRRARYKFRELSERNVWLAHPLVRRLLWLWICHANTVSPERRARLKAILISYGYTDEELEQYILDEERRQALARGELGGEGDGNEGGAGKGKKKKKGKSSFGKCAAGKPGKGWPHAIGTMLFQWLWGMLMSPPDEAFLSRAREYFDVQANILLETCNEAIGEPMSGQDCPFQQKVAIACLNLVVCIAKNVVAPAQEIADEDVEMLLELNGAFPKPVKPPKSNKKGGKGKKKNEEPATDAHLLQTQVENLSRNEGWPETTLPLSMAHQVTVIESPTEIFKKNLIWYQPRAPEFVYNGPRLFPVDMRIQDDDEGETVWHIESLDDIPPEKIIPEIVPPFYENVRLTTYAFPNPDKEEKPQPWYIMSDACYYEPGPRIADMTPIAELTEMFFRMMGNMMSMPGLSMTALLEMMKQQASAADSVIEEVAPEDALLDNKRTIILQRIYVNFFGFAFRDYNNQTKNIMQSLCHRAAVMVRHIYRYTAYTLWTLQRRPFDLCQRPQSCDNPPDDPEMLQAWDDWLAWLSAIATAAGEWAVWLQICDAAVMELAILAKPKPYKKWVNKARLEAESKYELHEKTVDEGEYYAEKANSMQQVNNRPISDDFVYEKIKVPTYPTISTVSVISETNRSHAASRKASRSNSKHVE